MYLQTYREVRYEHIANNTLQGLAEYSKPQVDGKNLFFLIFRIIDNAIDGVSETHYLNYWKKN